MCVCGFILTRLTMTCWSETPERFRASISALPKSWWVGFSAAFLASNWYPLSTRVGATLRLGASWQFVPAQFDSVGAE